MGILLLHRSISYSIYSRGTISPHATSLEPNDSAYGKRLPKKRAGWLAPEMTTVKASLDLNPIGFRVQG